MNKGTLRAALLLLSLLMLLATSCNPLPQQPTVTDSVAQTEAATEAPSPATLQLSGSYRVVLPTNASLRVSEAAKSLYAELTKQLSGAMLLITTDDLSPIDTEICIGVTNRPSGTVTLEPNQVCIYTKEQRIFILAENEDCLTAAVELFFTQLTVDGKSVTIPAELNVKQTVAPIIQEETTMKIKLLTYNIANGREVSYNFRVIAKDILNSGAEIVALQEVDKNTSRNGYQDTMELLKQYTGWEYYYYAPTLENYREGQYGIAILSKHPIVSAKHTELPEAEEGLERRVLLEAVIRIGELELTCFVSHCNQKSIDLQLGAMADHAAGKEPYVVMGDFNYSKLPLFQTHFPKADFVNLAPTAFPTTHNGHCFDNMILSEGVKKGQVLVTENDHSDHFMLYCEVEIALPKK